MFRKIASAQFVKLQKTLYSIMSHKVTKPCHLQLEKHLIKLLNQVILASNASPFGESRTIGDSVVTHFPRIFTIALTAVSLVPATASTSFADPNRYIPVLEQRAAILDCRYDMGLRGTANFGGVWPEVPPGGQTVQWIVPNSNLTPVQTDQINECADKRLGRANTPRFASRTEKVKVKHNRCPPWASVMYRGSGYCIKGR